MEYPDGYTSWSPKKVFEEAYRETSGLSFGLAIEALEKDKRVSRKAWGGADVWLAIHREPGVFLMDLYDLDVTYEDYITMKTKENTLVPWLPSQADIRANDWFILE